jgi:hypothetical protein
MPSIIFKNNYTSNNIYKPGEYRAIAQALASSFPLRRPGFKPRSGHVGFVVDKVALGQVSSEYFDFPCQFSFHRLLHIHHHLSSRAGTIGQLVADVPSGLSLTAPQKNKKENYKPENLVILGDDRQAFRGYEFHSRCDLCNYLLIHVDCSLRRKGRALEM